MSVITLYWLHLYNYFIWRFGDHVVGWATKESGFSASKEQVIFSSLIMF
jgi:hypothetical protein